MITIRLEDGAIRARLAETAERLGDLSPVTAEIAEFLFQSTRKRFSVGAGPDGSPWAKRSRVTLDRYAAMNPPRVPGPHPLTVSGGLMRSILPFSGPTQAGVGSSAIYAAAMQFGAAQGQFGAAIGRTRPSDKRPKSQDYFFPIPWGNIPARPFLGLSVTDREGILETLAEWLDPARAP
jgi:phage virion morphogenesis protein